MMPSEESFFEQTANSGLERFQPITPDKMSSVIPTPGEAALMVMKLHHRSEENSMSSVSEELRLRMLQALISEVERQTDDRWPVFRSNEHPIGLIDADIDFGELAVAAIEALRSSAPRTSEDAALFRLKDRMAYLLTGIEKAIRPLTLQGEDRIWRAATKACELVREAEEEIRIANTLENR